MVAYIKIELNIPTGNATDNREKCTLVHTYTHIYLYVLAAIKKKSTPATVAAQREQTISIAASIGLVRNQ